MDQNQNTAITAVSQSDLTDDLPPGEYDGLCVDITEQHGVDRKKFGTELMEKADVVYLTFEVMGRSGFPRQIRTREFRLSFHEKSSLSQFITEWAGQVCDVSSELEMSLRCHARLTLDVVTGVKDPSKKYVQIVKIAPAVDAGQDGGK